MALNVAEGVGEFSASEIIESARRGAGRDRMLRIVFMLIRMVRAVESGTGTGTSTGTGTGKKPGDL